MSVAKYEPLLFMGHFVEPSYIIIAWSLLFVFMFMDAFIFAFSRNRLIITIAIIIIARMERPFARASSTQMKDNAEAIIIMKE